MKILELSEYFVRVRSVPPHARAAVYNAEKAPPFPRREIQSVAGGTETHDELEKSEAAQTWREEMSAFQVRQRERSVDFNLDYGVVDWRPRSEPPGDDAPWLATAPKGWEFPATLVKYGVLPSEDKRVDFIKYGLIQTDDDRDQVDHELLGEFEPITEEEVARALTPFDLMRGKKPLHRAQGKSGITASAEFQEGAAMFAWKIPPDEWFVKRRDVRVYLMAIAEGVSRIEHAALED